MLIIGLTALGIMGAVAPLLIGAGEQRAAKYLMPPPGRGRRRR